jgi:hypothetical protein
MATASSSPAGTPKDVIAFLNPRDRLQPRGPEMKERQAALGNDIVASKPEEFGRWIKAKLALWARSSRRRTSGRAS